MSMKLIKKSGEYSIYQRGDDRYAVKDADKKPVNGEEKVRILLAEGLIKVAEPGAPAEEEAAPEETTDEAAEGADESDGEAGEGEEAEG
ncbi:MAG: hypothetical protein AAF933_03275 [Pseudomonadota bacterium]